MSPQKSEEMALDSQCRRMIVLAQLREMIGDFLSKPARQRSLEVRENARLSRSGIRDSEMRRVMSDKTEDINERRW